MELNKLIFNVESDNFETTATYQSKQFDIKLCDFNKEDLAGATKFAAEIFTWISEHGEEAKAFAASELLKLKNDDWLAEGEDPLSEKRFISMIELDGVLGFSEGGFEIYFNDNDLFWGHTIIVDVDEKFELSDVTLAG